MRNLSLNIVCLLGLILSHFSITLQGQNLTKDKFYFPKKSTITKTESKHLNFKFQNISEGKHIKNSELNFHTNLLKCTKNVSQNNFIAVTDTFNSKRFWSVFALSNTAYVSTTIGVSKLWYSQYEKTAFHFIKDGRNWKQMDKMGHTWTAYTETVLLYDLYKWAGLKEKNVIVLAALSATLYQGTIEILDGQSAAWGASWGDLAANSLGVGLAAGQYLLWEEQKVLIKFSANKVNYQSFDQDLQRRAVSLYGRSISENILKDYNGQTYWLSFNPFPQSSKWPIWLNIAVGTGVHQVFGATSNIWTDNNINYDYAHITPFREYYLSLDINLKKVNTQYAWLNIILHSINSIKIPAPTLVLSDNQLRAKAFYF